MIPHHDNSPGSKPTPAAAFLSAPPIDLSKAGPAPAQAALATAFGSSLTLSAPMTQLLDTLRKGAPASAPEARARRARAHTLAQRAKWVSQSSLGLMLFQFILALNDLSLDPLAGKTLFCSLAAGLLGGFFCWMTQDDKRRDLTPVSELSQDIMRRGLRILDASPSARRWRDQAVASGRDILLLDLHAMGLLLEQDERDALAREIAALPEPPHAPNHASE